NRQNTASSPEPCPHLLCRKVRSGTLRWLRPFRLSAWRGRTPVLQYRVKCFFLWLSSQELFKFFNYNPVLLEHLPVLATAEVVVQPLEVAPYLGYVTKESLFLLTIPLLRLTAK